MCRPAILPMMKRGNDAIGSCHWVKSKLPFRELFRNTNFCIQIMWQKGSTFLAIVTPIVIDLNHRSPEKVFYFLKKSIQFACGLRLDSCILHPSTYVVIFRSM